MNDKASVHETLVFRSFGLALSIAGLPNKGINAGEHRDWKSLSRSRHGTNHDKKIKKRTYTMASGMVAGNVYITEQEPNSKNVCHEKLIRGCVKGSSLPRD